MCMSSNAPLHIGFLSESDPQDRCASSGTFHSMAKALSHAGFTVTWIPVKSSSFIRNVYLKAVKVATRLFPYFKKYLPVFPAWQARVIAKNIDQCLLDSCDAIFAPMQAITLSAIHTRTPIVYLSDATYRVMWDYYWFHVPKADIRALERMEQTALDKAATIIYPCQWAAESAVRDYGQDPQKIHLAYFGPNFKPRDMVPHHFTFNGSLQLLFVGVNWKRKGGPIAVDACRWLNENGISAILHIVGVKRMDRAIRDLSFIQDEGFLNKNRPEDYAKLLALYHNSDCFLLPTQAECTGVSFTEACAFGLPCFSHRTGGVEDYILDGETGRLLPLGSSGEDFGHAIKKAILSGEMESMSRATISFSKKRLNWDKWADIVSKAIIQTIQSNKVSE